MKRHLLYFLLFTLALCSCKKFKTEPFMENPDKRLSADLSLYQTQLTRAEFGWKAYLLTDSRGFTAIEVAAFLFSFKDNRVTMSADYVTDEKEQKQEGTYRLKALQRPTLIFDTYSILHKITDPTPSVFKGVTGHGHLADFEYAFISASTDTIKLEGTFYKNKLYLIRSKSAADNSTAFSAKKDVKKTLSSLRTYFMLATINGIDYDEINYNPKKNVISFIYTDSDGKTISVSSKCFCPDPTSLVFFNPITIGNKTLTHIKDIIYDASSKIIKATTSYGELFQIKEKANAPLHYDATTADKFIKKPRYGGNSSTQWSESHWGFTVDGVVDAYDLQKIPNFEGLGYYHKLSARGYQRILLYTSFGWYGINVTTIVSGGKIFIKPYANGPSYDTPPAEIKSKIDNTMNSFLTEEGFYVIQTDENSYDLVAAKDARKWITFE